MVKKYSLSPPPTQAMEIDDLHAEVAGLLDAGAAREADTLGGAGPGCDTPAVQQEVVELRDAVRPGWVGGKRECAPERGGLTGPQAQDPAAVGARSTTHTDHR